MKVTEIKETTQYSSVTWNNSGFIEAEPECLWQRLPTELKQIAKSEIESGNSVGSILENRNRNIVLLHFQKKPRTKISKTTNLVVHKSFQNGNYCYDGTIATYEHLESGCFLAFDDPDYVHESL